MAVARASSRFTPRTRMGDMAMFSSTERCGNRLKDWNTKPMRLRMRFSSRAVLPGAWMSNPSTVSWPELISSSRLTVRIRVDLPEPDGPHTTTTSPGSTSALMSHSAW